MKDSNLDEFNRELAFLSYSSYIHHIDDVTLVNRKIRELKETAATFPACISLVIQSMEDRTQASR